MDPKPTIGVSEYSTLGNNPILFRDLLGDTLILTSRFQKDEHAMEAYRKFLNSTGGRTFKKAFDKGGKFYNVSVTLDVARVENGAGETEAFAVGKDGKERAIISIADYESRSKKGLDNSSYSTQIGVGEKLRIRINIRPDNAFYFKLPNGEPVRFPDAKYDNMFNAKNVRSGLTILHEFQHAFIYASYLYNPNYRSVGNGAWQHTIMGGKQADKNNGVNYFQQRYEYIKQNGGVFRFLVPQDNKRSQDEYFKEEANNYAL